MYKATVWYWRSETSIRSDVFSQEGCMKVVRVHASGGSHADAGFTKPFKLPKCQFLRKEADFVVYLLFIFYQLVRVEGG